MPYTSEVKQAHDRTIACVKKLWGRARDYQCVLCFDNARDWAFLWRTHSPSDTDGFVPLCRLDHMDYDEEQSDRGKSWRGKKRPEHSQAMTGNQNRKGIKFKSEQNHGGAKIGNKNRIGKKHSEETKAKMRVSRAAYLERIRES